MADPQPVDLTRQQDGGAVKKILEPGRSFFRPAQGDWLDVNYTCTLANGPESGRVVEDHFEAGVVVILGQSNVLPAVAACFLSMQIGERCELLVQPQHAYGDKGTDLIPPGSELRFIIFLKDVRGCDVTEERDGGVRKSILRPSQKKRRPTNGTQVQIRLRRIPPDLSAPTSPFSSFCFTLGRASRTSGLCRGVDVALRSMRSGELARCEFRQSWAWAGAERAFCEIELTDFEKYKEIWKMNTEQKLSQSAILKVKAARLVEEGLHDVALPLYHRVISYLEADVGFSEPADRSARCALLLACHLNAALCHLRSAQFSSCIEQCGAALQIEEFCQKALFRRAQARQMLGEPKEAAKDLKLLLSKFPKNEAARVLLTKCNAFAKVEKLRERQLCRQVFENVESWGDPTSGAGAYGSCGQFTIDTWSNDLAEGMMSIPQELEAFGEEMPELRHRHHSQGSTDG